MPDNPDSRRTSRPLDGRRRISAAPREVVLGLDRLERRISLAGAGLGLALALVTLAQWIGNVANVTTHAPSKSDTCPKGYHHHATAKLCELITHSSNGQWEIRFAFIFVVALFLLFFALRRKRAGVVCFSVFLGLGLGVGTGLAFVFLGLWLLFRAYRLQKYGDASFAASTRVAKERGREKRSRRSTTRDSSRDSPSSSNQNHSAAPAPPEASKRYTPKKTPRRR